MAVFAADALKIDDPNFEPSTRTKRCWLFVRKTERRVGSLKLPGLFQITSLEGDILMLALALLLECWGLFMLVSSGGIPFLYQLSVIVAAIVVDVLFAILYHIPQATVCLLKNRTVIAPLTDPPDKQKARIEQLDRDIKRLKWLRAPAAFVIVVLACVKIFLYEALQGRLDTLVISVMVSYVVVACIHLFFTGYALYGTRAVVWFWWDRNQYLSDRGHRVTWYRKHEMATWYRADGNKTAEPNEICLTIGDQQHRTVKNQERRCQISIERLEHDVGDNKKDSSARSGAKYALFTWGLFTDEHLDSLLNSQEEKSKETVAANGVSHQLLILASPPVTPFHDGNATIVE